MGINIIMDLLKQSADNLKKLTIYQLKLILKMGIFIDLFHGFFWVSFIIIDSSTRK